MRLTYETVTEMDLSGFGFYVELGDFFDADDYCEIYNIDINDLDQQDIKGTGDAAGRLMHGEFLLVSHE